MLSAMRVRRQESSAPFEHAVSSDGTILHRPLDIHNPCHEGLVHEIAIIISEYRKMKKHAWLDTVAGSIYATLFPLLSRNNATGKESGIIILLSVPTAGGIEAIPSF